jgi:hypothetical protein
MYASLFSFGNYTIQCDVFSSFVSETLRVARGYLRASSTASVSISRDHANDHQEAMGDL